MGLDDEDLEHAHGGNAPVSDVFAAIVLALGIGFACCGNRYHDAFFQHALVVLAGFFVALIIANLFFHAPAVSDDAKLIACACVGVCAWFALVWCFRAETLPRAFGASAGVASAALMYNVAAEIWNLSEYFFVVALAAGGYAGYLLGTLNEDSLRSLRSGGVTSTVNIATYAATGGFLMMSSANYWMWRSGTSARGDLWVSKITDVYEHGLDLGARSNHLCFFVWLASAAGGAFAQNTVCAGDGRHGGGNARGGGERRKYSDGSGDTYATYSSIDV